MEKRSTYAVAYLPRIFFDRASKDLFTGNNRLVENRISYAWLVRYYRLFEAVSDWMSINSKVKVDAVTLIAAWANSTEISNLPFSSDTGRMTSYTSLLFVKRMDNNLSDDKIKQLYSAISKVLKKWDAWYLSSIGNKVQSVISNTLGAATPDYARILVSTDYYKYGTDPSLLFDRTSHPSISEVYEVSYMKDRDKDFDQERISPVQIKSSDPIIPSPPNKDEKGSTVIDGPLDLAKLEEYRQAKKRGENVSIKGFVGNNKVLTAAEQAEEDRKMKAVNNDLSNTPILDWFIERTSEEK